MQAWHRAKIIHIEDETPSTKRFWFELPELERFDFAPGQFVTLDLPIHEKPAKRWRSYSIASWPDGSNRFELVIVLLEGGAGTHYLFHEADVGTEIPCRGPQGVFTLPPVIDRDLFFICTGTGIAPFRSMLHHIFINNLEHRNLYLIFGCRLLCDGLYADEMQKLQEKLPSFRYLPTYSRETDENLRRGYVHALYEEIIAQRGHPDAWFYLCGWKEMIHDAKERITALGYDRKLIRQELYG